VSIIFEVVVDLLTKEALHIRQEFLELGFLFRL